MSLELPFDKPKYFDGEEPYWEFMGEVGHLQANLDNGDVDIAFSVGSIIPGDEVETVFEGEDISYFMELIDKQISSYTKIKAMINYFLPEIIMIDTNLMEGSTQYHIDITIPANHPKLIK